MARSVAERTEASLRQPRDGAARTTPDRSQVRIDPRHDLVDVKGLPHRLSARAAVVPVREPAAAVTVEAGVGKDDDQRQTGGGLLGVAEVDPVRRPAAGAVKEVEHRVAALRIIVVAVGQGILTSTGRCSAAVLTCTSSCRGSSCRTDSTWVPWRSRSSTGSARAIVARAVSIAMTSSASWRMGAGRADMGAEHPAARGARASATPLGARTGQIANYFTSTSMRIQGWMQHWKRCFPFERPATSRRLPWVTRVLATATLEKPPAHSGTVGSP